MKIFAIADPHLSFGTPGKGMERFGANWGDHAQKIETSWREAVTEDDLVLIAGDISWAMKLDGARPDIEFLGSLPGTKVMIKGNHDYWWQSIKKVRAILPDRFHAIDADAIEVNGVIVCGTRLWDVPGISFDDLIEWREEPGTAVAEKTADEQAEPARPDTSHIYHREMGRLRRSLEHARQLAADSEASQTIVMTHYPPCNAHLTGNELTDLFEQSGVSDVIFGHLHNFKPGQKPFGIRNDIHYHLTACDWLNFQPKPIGEVG